MNKEQQRFRKGAVYTVGKDKLVYLGRADFDNGIDEEETMLFFKEAKENGKGQKVPKVRRRLEKA